jgi:hypothetical protein
VQPLTPICQIKRYSEDREGRFTTGHGKRQSKHSAHLQPSLGYRHGFYVLIDRRIRGREQKACVVKPSQSQVW